MAVGKNKKMGKKGNKKKAVDPMTRKDWYGIKAPAMFNNRLVGQTLVNRTQGTRMPPYICMITSSIIVELRHLERFPERSSLRGFPRRFDEQLGCRVSQVSPNL